VLATVRAFFRFSTSCSEIIAPSFGGDASFTIGEINITVTGLVSHLNSQTILKQTVNFSVIQSTHLNKIRTCWKRSKYPVPKGLMNTFYEQKLNVHNAEAMTEVTRNLVVGAVWHQEFKCSGMSFPIGADQSCASVSHGFIFNNSDFRNGCGIHSQFIP
jgi:hypothetical protein